MRNVGVMPTMNPVQARRYLAKLRKQEEEKEKAEQAQRREEEAAAAEKEEAKRKKANDEHREYLGEILTDIPTLLGAAAKMRADISNVGYYVRLCVFFKGSHFLVRDPTSAHRLEIEDAMWAVHNTYYNKIRTPDEEKDRLYRGTTLIRSIYVLAWVRIMIIDYYEKNKETLHDRVSIRLDKSLYARKKIRRGEIAAVSYVNCGHIGREDDKKFAYVALYPQFLDHENGRKLMATKLTVADRINEDYITVEDPIPIGKEQKKGKMMIASLAWVDLGTPHRIGVPEWAFGIHVEDAYIKDTRSKLQAAVAHVEGYSTKTEEQKKETRLKAKKDLNVFIDAYIAARKAHPPNVVLVYRNGVVPVYIATQDIEATKTIRYSHGIWRLLYEEMAQYYDHNTPSEVKALYKDSKGMFMLANGARERPLTDPYDLPDERKYVDHADPLENPIPVGVTPVKRKKNKKSAAKRRAQRKAEAAAAQAKEDEQGEEEETETGPIEEGAPAEEEGEDKTDERVEEGAPVEEEGAPPEGGLAPTEADGGEEPVKPELVHGVWWDPDDVE